MVVCHGGAKKPNEDYEEVEELGCAERIDAEMRAGRAPRGKTVHETVDGKGRLEVVRCGIKAWFGGPKAGAEGGDKGAVVDGKKAVIDAEVAERRTAIGKCKDAHSDGSCDLTGRTDGARHGGSIVLVEGRGAKRLTDGDGRTIIKPVSGRSIDVGEATTEKITVAGSGRTMTRVGRGLVSGWFLI